MIVGTPSLVSLPGCGEDITTAGIIEPRTESGRRQIIILCVNKKAAVHSLRTLFEGTKCNNPHTHVPEKGCSNSGCCNDHRLETVDNQSEEISAHPRIPQKGPKLNSHVHIVHIQYVTCTYGFVICLTMGPLSAAHALCRSGGLCQNRGLPHMRGSDVIVAPTTHSARASDPGRNAEGTCHVPQQ